MGLHGGLGDPEFVGDLLVEQALGQHGQHAHLLRRQGAEAADEVGGLRVLGGREIHVRRGPGVAGKHRLDGAADAVDVDGFRNEPGGAEIHGPADHGGLLRGRHDHHRKLGILRPERHEAGKALDARHGQVEQDQVDVAFLGEGGVQVIHPTRFHHPGLGHDGGNGLPQRAAKQRMVVGNDDRGGLTLHVCLLPRDACLVP